MQWQNQYSVSIGEYGLGTWATRVYIKSMRPENFLKCFMTTWGQNSHIVN